MTNVTTACDLSRDEKIAQLRVLQSRISPDLLKLTVDYRRTLEDYWARRSRVGSSPQMKGLVGESLPLLVRDAVRQLNQLDQIRADLKQAAAAKKPEPVVSATP